MKIVLKHIYTALKWLILTSAYLFLGYKLFVYDGYAELAYYFSTAGVAQYLFLLLVFLLLPLNLLCESLKWRTLVSGLQPLSVSLAFKSVLIGQTGAFFTPNHLGDYPTRALLLRSENAVPAVALGFVGSAVLTAVITFFGSLALFFLYTTYFEIFNFSPFYFVVFLLIGFLPIAFLAFFYKPLIQFLQKSKKKWLRRLGEGLSYLALCDFWQIVGLSALRFVVFSLQFYLMLLFAGVSLLPLQALIGIPTYYLMVTCTPSFGAFEAGVRALYADLVFSVFSDNYAGIVIAGVLLWVVNYCVPMIVGSFLFRKVGATLPKR